MSTRAKKLLSFRISCSVYGKFSIAVSGSPPFADGLSQMPKISTSSFQNPGQITSNSLAPSNHFFRVPLPRRRKSLLWMRACAGMTEGVSKGAGSPAVVVLST